MPDPMLYVIAQFDEASEPLFCPYLTIPGRLGCRDEQTPDLLPHITMGSFPLREEAWLLEVLSCAALKKRMQIPITSIGAFGTRVCYLTPEATPELLELRRLLEPRAEEERPWVPHTSLFIGSEEDFIRVKQEAERIFTPFTATVSILGLYSFWPPRKILQVTMR